jgi:hypothetical protein
MEGFVTADRYPTLMKDADAIALKADLVGSGGARRVYTVAGDAGVVIKEVHLPYAGANHNEWLIWNAVRDTELAAIFGRCVGINESGKLLLMERLGDLAPEEWRHTPAVPEWLTDIWPKAFGKNAEGVIKLRDYALLSLPDTLVLAERAYRGWQIAEQEKYRRKLPR